MKWKQCKQAIESAFDPPKFAVNSLNGRDAFWIVVMNKLLYCLTVQLVKMIKSCEHTGKKFILLYDSAENTG